MKQTPSLNSTTDTTSQWLATFFQSELPWTKQLLELLSSDDPSLGTEMTALRQRLLDYAVTGLVTYAVSSMGPLPRHLLLSAFKELGRTSLAVSQERP
jgi:hypothetical protein